ncbi:hypothetical protein ABZP36_018525 [Zizania latifolia]
MAVGIKIGHQVASAAALLVLLVAATFHFHALHARTVAAPAEPLPSRSTGANAGASHQPPSAPAAGGLPQRSASPSGCTNYGRRGGGTACPPR